MTATGSRSWEDYLAEFDKMSDDELKSALDEYTRRIDSYKVLLCNGGVDLDRATEMNRMLTEEYPSLLAILRKRGLMRSWQLNKLVRKAPWVHLRQYA